MRVLLVEDSKILLKSVSTALRRNGYVVDVASDGEEGLWLARSDDYDAIILDIMLPKVDGMEILRSLRKSEREVHVLLLTARDAVGDRVTGLQAGADDYLTKPFSMDELLARVEALCRRSYRKKSSVVRVGDLSLDFNTRTVERAGSPVLLTPREYRLLEYLARRKDEVVSRADIETHIYDANSDLMSNTVDSAISILRKKITRNNTLPNLIRTRRGLGYVLGETLPGEAA